jgi:hypothetical protein
MTAITIRRTFHIPANYTPMRKRLKQALFLQVAEEVLVGAAGPWRRWRKAARVGQGLAPCRISIQERLGTSPCPTQDKCDGKKQVPRVRPASAGFASLGLARDKRDDKEGRR